MSTPEQGRDPIYANDLAELTAKSDARLASEDAREHPLDFDEARNLMLLALATMRDWQHAEHFGAFCPVCGLISATERTVREWTP